MGDMDSVELLETKFSRRTFIKGVIAVGATATATSQFLGRPGIAGAQTMAGSAARLITLRVNDQE
jgi:hypothetical protein